MSNVEELFKTATDHHLAGDLHQAIEIYKRINSVDPGFGVVHHNMGLAYRDLGDLAQAIACYSAALQADPSFAAACYDMGNAYNGLGEHARAIDCYKKAVGLAPDFADAYQNLAVTLQQNGDPQEAERCYKEMREKFPERTALHYHFGKTLKTLGSGLAISCFREVMEQDPGLVEQGPRRIRIETSSACNLRCRHCPTGSNYSGARREVMGMEVFDELVRQMATIDSLEEGILYLGGEPLLNRDLAEICARVKQETPVSHIQFNTNAMLLDEGVCRQLSRAGVDLISVSVDGRTPEENDRIRRGASYDVIVRNVAMLRRYVGATTTICIANTLFRRASDPDRPTAPQFLGRDFSDLPLDVNYAMKWPGLDRESIARAGLAVVDGKADRFCEKPFTEIALRINGDVALCCNDLLGEQVMGNIFSDSLLSIWQGERYRGLRRHILNREVEGLPGVCCKCPLYTGERLIIQ